MGLSLRARELLERFNKDVAFADAVPITADALALQWPELDVVLPDHGLPQGVVEVRAPHALGGGTSLALASIRAAHERDARAWCAWIDPDGTLYSPGVAMSGVDLNRLALVRPPRADLLRIAIKMARSQAFEVLVLDVDPSPGSAGARSHPTSHPAGRRRANLQVGTERTAANGGSDVRGPRRANLQVGTERTAANGGSDVRGPRRANLQVGTERTAANGGSDVRGPRRANLQVGTERKRPFPLEVFVRKIALLAAEGGATVILLTDANVHRSVPLPVALRLELARTQSGMGVRVGKERHGRIGLAKTVSWGSRPRIELAV